MIGKNLAAGLLAYRTGGALTAALAILFISSIAHSATVTVNAFAPYSATPSNGVWYEMRVEEGGAASTVDLTGVGGNLENNQPLPVGAALLTTGSNNLDVAHVGVVDTYGNASNILMDGALEISYSFYKVSAGDLNPYAAPAIRLTLNNPSPVGSDGYGSLVYEPYWQTDPWQSAPGAAVSPDEWITAVITSTTGRFWWDGGFGELNSSGGPPLRTLSDWASVFDEDFTDADLLALSVGVGSYNQGQTGYFDDVSISYTGYIETYNFEPIPEPSTGCLLLLGLAGLSFCDRKRSP
ncbi:MAG: PEP-CTERM sorting domain-containing protein [bacterium]|jgi:hypothetical protein|nr:PEP-CTERM sorting domain-containing protein [bacterium]MDP7074453.1 PEP-CTERM sorting domain-containing protein [Myxococcota bacterium]